MAAKEAFSLSLNQSRSFFDKKYSLTEDELIEKAKNELHEIPDTLQTTLESFRQAVIEQPNLHADLSDSFLLRFLRARKYDKERALKLICSYYRSKASYPEFFGNLLPSAVMDVIESGVVTLLPGLDKKGRLVLFFDSEPWDISVFSAEDIIRAGILCIEALVEIGYFQICGLVFVVDISKFGFLHMLQVSPFTAYKFFSYVQNWSPVRLQGMFFVRESTFFDVAFTIMIPFLSSKLRDRIHFLKEDVEKLKEFFPAETLPVSLGGTHDPEESSRNWREHLESQEEHIKTQLSTYGYK